MLRGVNIAFCAILVLCLTTGCGGSGGSGGGQNVPRGGSPVVNAGEDVTVDPGDHVFIRSTAGALGGAVVMRAEWTQLSGPAVQYTRDNRVGLQFDAPATGGQTLTFRFTVWDSQGHSNSDEVSIFVRDAAPAPNPAPSPNQLPEVTAGADLVVGSGEQVTIRASASDPDGSIVYYRWTELEGIPVTLAGGDTATLQFLAPEQSGRRLIFRLWVKDDQGAMASADVTVWVDPGDPIDTAAIADPGLRQCVESLGATYVVEVTYFGCGGGGVASLEGLGQFTSMTSLTLTDVRLTTADLSMLPNLEYLSIYMSEVANISFPANSKLRDVLVNGNHLTSLNVAALTELEHLSVSENELTTLDLSSNSRLQELIANDNKLASVDLPAGAALVLLVVSNNRLTTLVVPEGSGLGSLDASGNLLAAVDLSHAADLAYLYLQDNQLTSLDLAANPLLRALDVSRNLLTQIHFPGESALEMLTAESNALSTIDVSSCAELGDLHVADNRLTAIDLSHNSRLGILDVSGNALTTLDVSGNPELSGLAANRNQLTAIDLSANPKLQRLELEDNLLTAIDLSGTRVWDVSLAGNRLTSFVAPAREPIFQLDVSGSPNIPCSDLQRVWEVNPYVTLIHDVANCEPRSWVPGVFEPASVFAAQCANPRTGTDSVTGGTYRDVQGSTLDENNWLRSWSNDLYLWYDEITDQNPANYSTMDYFMLMKTFESTPSGTAKDQFHFAMDTKTYRSESETGVVAGYGAQFAILANYPPREVVIAYTEPGSPATTAPANLARGALILTVDGADLVNGNDVDTLNAGLFPDGIGERHQFTVRDLGTTGARTFTMTSEEVVMAPVQEVETIDTQTGRVGYFVFNDHMATAERPLIDAFTYLRNIGVQDLVLDLRYNGGGFLAIASEVAYMIAGPAATSGKTFEELEFNDKHTTYDPVTGELLEPLPFLDIAVGFSAAYGTPLPTLNLARVFVLTGTGTCSASEAIINGLRGIGVEVIQIGAITCGKPYGFYPADNCGTTYFSIQFRGINALGYGDYSDGFVPDDANADRDATLPGCAVDDDFTHLLGDSSEGRLATALRYRDDGACPPMAAPEPRALSSPAIDLSRVEGVVPKPLWLQNRIMRRHPSEGAAR